MNDVIIVGGGLQGLLTAYYLQAAGMRVMLIDQNELARESSWASSGLLSPLYPWRAKAPVSALVQYSRQHYPALCDQLHQTTGINPQWLPSGLLITETLDTQQAKQWAAQQGESLLELNNPADVQACEASVNPTIETGLYFPNIGQIRSPRFIAALKAHLRQHPVLIAEHTPVTGFYFDQQRLAGVYLDHWLFKAQHILLSAGAWTGSLLQLIQTTCPFQLPDLTLPIQPLAAQSILYRGVEGLLKRAVVHQDKLLIPREDGRIVVGAVFESLGLNKHITSEASQTLAQQACKLIPALCEEPLRNHWASLLSTTPDGIPYLGAHPMLDGLYIQAGHGDLGLATGLASARLLADAITQQTTTNLHPSWYSIGARATQSESDLSHHSLS